MAARFPFTAALAAAALLAPATAAHAAPPSNDLPGAAAPFAPYTAANGVPLEQQAIAELAEATADPGLVRCLGDESFERTVWFFVPAASVAAEVTVDAGGRTLDPIDLAVFVQPEVTTTPGGVNHTVPNACAGLGDGGASDAVEPGNAVSAPRAAEPPGLRPGRPPRRGRRARGRARGALAARRPDRRPSRPCSATARSRSRPSRGPSARPRVPLANATVTGGRRRHAAVPEPRHRLAAAHPRQRRAAADLRQRRRRLDAGGLHRRHAGRRPRARLRASATRPGAMEMIVPARKGRTLWIRVGTDDLLAQPATIRVEERARPARRRRRPRRRRPDARRPGRRAPRGVRHPEDRARADHRAAALRPARPLQRQARADRRQPPRRPRLRRRAAALRPARLPLRQGHDARSSRRASGRCGSAAAARFERGRYRLEVTGLDRLGERVKVRGTVQGRLR